MASSVATHPPFRVVRSATGSHCVATRSLAPGQVLLLEAPLVSTSTDVAPGLPSIEVEWTLVHALLSVGRAYQWARDFCRTGPPLTATSETHTELLHWLCSTHRVTVKAVLLLYQVVCANAFGLETPLLGVEYGAAFYEQACRFNHDCDPNCLSIRLGGNMAVFACAAIAEGQELRHSYLPPRLLVCPARKRRAHLHFECDCRRCARELMGSEEEEEEEESAAALGFPPGHAATPDGIAVASFTIVCATGDHAATVRQGGPLISHLAPLLRARPLAALDVVAPFLAAYWQLERRPASSTAEAALAADIYAGAAEALAATRAAQHGVDAHAVVGSGVSTFAPPRVAVQALRSASAIQALLLRARLRESVVGPALHALAQLQQMYGGTFDWLRDDVPFVQAAPADGARDELLPSLAEAVAAAMAAGATAGAPLEAAVYARLPRLSLDACCGTACTKLEAVPAAFCRCSSCRAVKYCGESCQRAHWSAHRRVCEQRSPLEATVVAPVVPPPPGPSTVTLGDAVDDDDCQQQQQPAAPQGPASTAAGGGLLHKVGGMAWIWSS